MKSSFFTILLFIVCSCSTNHITHLGFKTFNSKLKTPQDIELIFNPKIIININDYQAEYFNNDYHTRINKYKNHTIEELNKAFFFIKNDAKYQLNITEAIYTEDVNYACVVTEENDEVCDYLNHLTVKIVAEIYKDNHKIKTIEATAFEKSKIKKNILFNTYSENSLSYKIEDMNTRCLDKLINKTTKYFNKKTKVLE